MQACKLVSRDWRNAFVALVRNARERLVVCSPFVSAEGTRVVEDNLTATFRRSGRIDFLTNLSITNVCQLATDPRAIRSLAEVVPKTTVVHLPGLHAKAYVADAQRAIITSGNLTSGGLYRNFEYGVELTDREAVCQVASDLLEYSGLGANVPLGRLVTYGTLLDEYHEGLATAQSTAWKSLRRRFRQAVEAVEDDLLSLRLAEGPIHGVFARTIEYLLRSQGPLSTVQLHPLIASLHPDLCDDSVDRVIDGKRFGKKWKHAVRTAQQQLKKLGKVQYADGIWCIV